MSNEIVKHEQGDIVRAQESLTVADIRSQIKLIQDLMKGAMQRDQHYGVVPGCGDKPTLLKPGAEKISMMFRLVPTYSVNRTDFENGHREYEVTCTLTHTSSGIPSGQGMGSASTMEGKFRYRWENTNRQVPKEYWENRDSDLLGGNTFFPRKKDGAWMIFQRVEHDTPADYFNTCLKMGLKRAHVCACLNATAASDIFTQDIEDLPGNEEDKKPFKPENPMMPKRKSEPAPANIEVNSGDIVETVTKKTGQGKKGPWTKYGVKIGGEWYGTFDVKIGEQAEALKGEQVEFEWKQDGEYKTLTDIRFALDKEYQPAEEQTPQPPVNTKVTADDDFLTGIDKPDDQTQASQNKLEDKRKSTGVK